MLVFLKTFAKIIRHEIKTKIIQIGRFVDTSKGIVVYSSFINMKSCAPRKNIQNFLTGIKLIVPEEFDVRFINLLANLKHRTIIGIFHIPINNLSIFL